MSYSSTRCSALGIVVAILALAGSAAHALPELAITGTSFSSTPQVGDQVVLAFELTNSGDQSAPSGPSASIEVDVSVDGTFLGRFAVEDSFGQPVQLSPGQPINATLDLGWLVPFKATPYTIDLALDPANQVAESDETNNTAQTSFTVECPSPTFLGPSDFGTVGGAFFDPATSRPNLMIDIPSSACPSVTLIIGNGTYHYDPPAGATTDAIVFRGDLSSGGSDPVDVTIEFDSSTAWNREIQFRGFTNPNRTLRIESYGGSSVLDFGELAGAPAGRALYGMLSFTGNPTVGPTRIAVRDLELRGLVDGAGNRLYEGGIYFGFDGSQVREVSVESVTIEGAKNAVLSKNAKDLSVRNSTFRDFSIGYYAAGGGTQERILLEGNWMENDTLDGRSRYGVFTAGALVDSAILGNTIRRVGERGLYPDAGSHTLWIHGNTITETGRGGNGAGINLGKDDLRGILVSDNVVRDIGEAPYTYSMEGVETIPIGLGVDTDSDGLSDIFADTFLDDMSSNVYYTTAWPNRPWNGYGILTSGGAASEPVALVGNTVERASGHGVIVSPGAERAVVYDNTLLDNGLDGLAVVPGYSYAFQFWYLERGGVSDLLIQDNLARDNERAGIEILPRSTPLFEAACVDSTNCPYASQTYSVCPAGTPSGPSCIARYDTACDPSAPGSRCFDPAWQSYRVDLHGNRLEDNGQANLVIDAQRAGEVAAAYTISGTQFYQTGAGTPHFVLEPSALSGAGALPRDCLTFRRGQPHPRAGTGDLAADYQALVTGLVGLAFETYDFTSETWTQHQPGSLYDTSGLGLAPPSSEGCGVPWIGIHRDSYQTFYLDTTGDGVYTEGTDTRFAMGAAGDLPLAGDWNGDGFDTAGIYRPSTRIFYLDVDGDGSITYGGQDLVYAMGPTDSKPVVGDWNGDGRDTIGVFHGPGTTFYLDVDGDGAFTYGSADLRYTVGGVDDEPIAGDWDGDGVTEIGLHRRADSLFFLDVDGDGAIVTANGDLQIPMGDTIDWAVVGDWDGDGRDQLGVYRPGDGRFFLDYNGDGINRASDGDLIYAIGGFADDRPVAGVWRY